MTHRPDNPCFLEAFASSRRKPVGIAPSSQSQALGTLDRDAFPDELIGQVVRVPQPVELVCLLLRREIARYTTDLNRP